MPHEGERPFHDRVVDYLEAHYGEDRVDTDVYLGETGRFADVVVAGPLVTLAIEVENDFEAAVKGAGQTIMYAASFEDGVSAIVVPPGHVEEPEVDAFRDRGIPVVELDV